MEAVRLVWLVENWVTLNICLEDGGREISLVEILLSICLIEFLIWGVCAEREAEGGKEEEDRKTRGEERSTRSAPRTRFKGKTSNFCTESTLFLCRIWKKFVSIIEAITCAHVKLSVVPKR